MTEHHVVWTSPAPLWGRFGDEDEAGQILARFASVDQARPAILRFDSDDFMERLLAALAQSPRRIGELVARPETWRTPMEATPELIDRRLLPRRARFLERLRAGRGQPAAIATVPNEITTEVNAVPRTVPLKLFHPAHQRHYLVTANLVCARAGFPDRALASGGRDQVGVVLRRMLPPSPAITGVKLVEFAFVKDAQGARWQRVVPDGTTGVTEAQLVAGEELLPLFPMNFHEDNGQPRRLHAGVIPVGRREEYLSTRMQQVPADVDAGVAATPSLIAERKEQFRTDVSEPWKNVVRSATYAALRIVADQTSDVKAVTDNSSPDRRLKQAKKANQAAQVQSWLVLLDFADYLALHVKPVWDKILDSSRTVTGNAQTLYDWLVSNETRPTDAWDGLAGDHVLTLADALRRVVNARKSLEQTTANYPDPAPAALPWPDFSYLLAGVRGPDGSWKVEGLHQKLAPKTVVPAAGMEGEDESDPRVPTTAPAAYQAAESAAADVDKLVQLVMNAIDKAQPAAPAPPLPFAARLRDAIKTTAGDEGWFVLRCVYIRCDCGPLQPVVASAPTAQFQLASFFDPDAPARPIRISLPTDTTPAGLRKHNKNAVLMLSDVLCGQVQRAKGLGLIDLVMSVLPWPLHKDLDLGGMDTCRDNSQTIGMICSLSIPIVTLCALILLIIMVSLLDLIFKWMPFFIMCLPVPGLKGKK